MGIDASQIAVNKSQDGLPEKNWADHCVEEKWFITVFVENNVTPKIIFGYSKINQST